MDKLTPQSLPSPHFNDLTYRCHLCQDTGYTTYEKSKYSIPYTYAIKCLNGNCNWWRWWKSESATINKQLEERFQDDDQ